MCVRTGTVRLACVCFGVLLGFAGQGASKQISLHTAETAMPPFFCAAKSNFKGTFGTNAKQPGSCEPG
jgi:hypothetical protein